MKRTEEKKRYKIKEKLKKLLRVERSPQRGKSLSCLNSYFYRICGMSKTKEFLLKLMNSLSISQAKPK